MFGKAMFGKDGEPMTLEEWAQKQKDLEYKRVAVDRLSVDPDEDDRSVVVSTVWTGLPSFEGALFETMVFADASHSVDRFTRRYRTERTAKAGHEQVAKDVQEAIAAEEFPHGKGGQE